MRDHQAHYPVRVMCRVLGVSPSGYYAWKKRGPSPRAVANAELLEEIRSIHEWSDGTYGAPRIHEELRDRGFEASLNRVARLMREAGLEGVSRRGRRNTTRRDPDARPAPDLVERDFTASGPDELWVADITYVPTWAGFVYLAVVLDAWSRRVVGWSMATHLRTDLVLDALNLGSTRPWPSGVGARRWGFGPRRARSGTRLITHSARAGSPRSNVNSSTGARFACRRRRGWPYSGSSRRGTTRTGVTLPWATSRRSDTRGSTRVPHDLEGRPSRRVFHTLLRGAVGRARLAARGKLSPSPQAFTRPPTRGRSRGGIPGRARRPTPLYLDRRWLALALGPGAPCRRPPMLAR